MQFEWYALPVVIVGLTLWLTGGVRQSVYALLLFSVFGGGAALIVGHANITPASLFLVFLTVHVLFTMFRSAARVRAALGLNVWLAIYSAYGAVAAYILPRLFHGLLYVPPMTANGRDLFAVVPLGPSQQNITTAIYMIGALLAAIGGVCASAEAASRRGLVRWAIIVAWVHVFAGIAFLVLTHEGAGSIIGFFRNGQYAELSQVESNVSRISGFFPEPSAYAAFAFGWFALMVELALRRVSTMWTLGTALALMVMIAACTSTTGYASLALYGVVLALRLLITPRGASAGMIAGMGLTILTAAVMALAWIALNPKAGLGLERLADRLTFAKFATLSGQIRLHLMRAALDCFTATWGIGTGPGSFRSSGLLLAILGSMGVVGLVAFTAAVMAILKPLRSSTWSLPGRPAEAIGVATAWAAVAALIPASIAAPNAAPGYVFAVLGGLSLGWRRVDRRAAAPVPLSFGRAGRVTAAA